MFMVLALVAAVVAISLPAAAQSSYATLSGTARDAAGAMIPGASVSVKNVVTGDVRKTTTNGVGYFTVTALPAGDYEVEVIAKGFGKWIAKGVVLNGADSKTMNIDLKIKAGDEVVEVTGSATEVALVDTGEKSSTIPAAQLNKLALATRNATEFVKILPGATLCACSGINKAVINGEAVGINDFVANGSHAGGLGGTNINGQAVDITQDGQHVFDPGAFGSATPVNPNPDMISEVKVLSASFTSDNAKGPVVINTVTKGGGNVFHGDARFNVRNDALNSNDAQNKMSIFNLPRPNSSYYYPGFSVGGPVVIPGTGFNKERKKLFFFDGFEYYRQRIDAGVARAFVPTADMLNGDFSKANTFGAGRFAMGSIPTAPAAGARPGFDIRAAAGCTITGGKLSSACIDPNALALMEQYLPAANVDPSTHGGFNFVQAFTEPQDSYQNVARGDVVFTENTKLYVTYSRQRETADMPLGLWTGSGDWVVPSPSATIGANSSDNVNVTFLHVFSPTMTSETRYGYTYINMPNSRKDPSKLSRSAISGFPTGIFNNPVTPSIVSWGQSVPNLGEIGHDFHPTMICYKGIPSVEENFTKVFGTHTTKYGFYYEHTYNKQDNWGQFMGVMTYDPWNTVTGNNYADMLMGIGFDGYYEQAVPPPTEIAQNISSFYAQDSWKMNRRITINYGMRLEHYAKPYSANGIGLAVFDPNKYSSTASVDANTGVVWSGIDPSLSLSGADSRFLFFSPRIGAAIDLFGKGKTVLRGGWGKYRAYDSLQSNAYTGPAQTAMGSVSYSCNHLYGGDTAASKCSTWENIDTNFIGAPTTWGKTLGPGLKGINVINQHDDEQPLVTSYSLNIDQELPAKFKLEVSYVGNHTDFSQATANINYIPLGAIKVAANQNCDSNCVQSYRPYNYQNIVDSVTAGKAQYDGLQLSLDRSTGWLTLRANYTFSKALGSNGWNVANGTMSAALPNYGTQAFWSVLPIDRAHVLSLAYVLEPPQLKGSRFVERLTGGWQLSGITQIESGGQLTNQSGSTGLALNYGRDNLTVGGTTVQYYDNIHMLGTPDVQLYPTITCNPTKGLKPGQYLNPSCFGPAPDGALGSSRLPYMPGPLFSNSDISLQRNIKITERQALQFRVSAFNFLNHSLTSFTGGDGNLQLKFNADGTLKNANPSSGHACPGPTCDAFGYADYKTGHRTMELGVKYTF
jgi:hypothetical protein